MEDTSKQEGLHREQAGAYIEVHTSTPDQGYNNQETEATNQPKDVTAMDTMVPALPELGERLLGRLAAIGITIAQYGHFLTHFIGSRFDYIRRAIEGEWRMVRNRVFLKDSLLVAHLAEDIVVGTGCRYDKHRHGFFSPYYILDLDNHGNEADLLDRYDRVVGALGEPSHLFRSSDSYGLHLYFFFDGPVDVHALRTPDGRDGAIVRLLAEQGLHEERGRVEFFPGSAHPVYGPQRRVRAPFGIGSRLLDPTTLEPLTRAGAAANLAHSTRMFEEGDVRIVDSTALIERSRTLGSPFPVEVRATPVSPERRGRRLARETARRVTSTPSGHDPAKVERILTVGLTDPGELNDAASALAFYFRFQRGLERDQAKAELLAWLEAQHNGQSRTFNASPDRARRAVVGVVDRVYAGDRPSCDRPARKWAPLPGLTEAEAARLLFLLDGDANVCDPSTGEADMLDRYKLESFGFQLLQLAKQYVLTMGAAPVTSDQLVGEYIVPMPARLRQGRTRPGCGFLKGIGRELRGAMWRALKNASVFVLERKGSKQARRWATYRVRLEVSPTNDSGVFFTLDQALVALLTPAQRRARYSAYRCRRFARRARRAEGGRDAAA